MTTFEKAVQYVRDNKTWSEAEDSLALERINNLRCCIDFASPEICTEIHDLMEEFSQENDLPEGWWYNEANEDDIFFEL